tara:strand:+ start:61340 stop:61540 length:201 start_codon:yes stop_codon:yes gene_type:complete
MKTVFLPASDELLKDLNVQDVQLVPFKPEFLVKKEGRKPRNWISGSSYQEAMERLRAPQASPQSAF